jgi:outer membrane protein W
MKKIVSILSLMGCLMLTAPGNANAQAVEQGNFIITPQYGFPNLFNLAIKTAYNNSTYTGVDIGGIGPAGLQFEYMVADKIGLGIKANYSSTSLTYTESTYDYTLKFVRYRVMPRFALHFGNSSNFDAYFGVAAGYSGFKISSETNDPNYDDTDVAITNPFPVGFRFDVGGSYFFTDFLGLNMEIGLGGGPVINGGLSFKF